jgi:ABC-type antimicrobial peptide transport system permease subunit
MLKLIYRQLVYDPLRTLLTCVAISSTLAVILLLEGFQTGLLVQLKNVSLNRGGDLIVAQTGVTNFIASRSLLPQLSREAIESIEGVKEAHPVTSVPVIYEQQGYRKSPVFFMVYDIGGGPAFIKEGQTVSKPRDIVIDESLAVLYDLKVGDAFIVADFEFHISGIAEQASALFTAFAFINYDDMIDFFFDSDLVGDISNLPLLSYLLVELHSGADKHAIAAAIEVVESEADVFLPEQIAKNDVALGKTLFGPVMGVLIGAGYIITLLVVGMIMFAAVHARLRNYGVMKALGFPNGSLVKQMVLESLVMILLAFPLALLLAQFAAWFIEIHVPLYMVPVLETVPLLRTFVAALVLGVIGAYLPYRFIARLDPAIVFRR